MPRPALLIQTSIRPNCASPVSTMRSTSARLVTSATTGTDLGPNAAATARQPSVVSAGGENGGGAALGTLAGHGSPDARRRPGDRDDFVLHRGWTALGRRLIGPLPSAAPASSSAMRASALRKRRASCRQIF